MLKFIGFMVMISASFAGGYYFGQRPVGTLLHTVSDLQHSLKELSRNVLDTTTGIERDLRRRQALVEAKSRLVQAKANIVEHNLSEAAKDLGGAIAVLEDATEGLKQDAAVNDVRNVAGSLRDLRTDVTKGKTVPRKKLDAVQHRLDQLLKT
jgi:hypothetical protein